MRWRKEKIQKNLGWERNRTALLALPVELLLIEESERRLVGRRTCLRRDSRLGLAQLRLHREELVLERGAWGRRALGYGRASRARGNHNWGGLGWSRRGLRRCKDCDGGRRLSLRCRRSESQFVPRLRRWRWPWRPAHFAHLRARPQCGPCWQQVGSSNICRCSRTGWSSDEVNILKTALGVWSPWELGEVAEGGERAKGGRAGLRLSGTSRELWHGTSWRGSTSSNLLLLPQFLFSLPLPLLF